MRGRRRRRRSSRRGEEGQQHEERCRRSLLGVVAEQRLDEHLRGLAHAAPKRRRGV
jgi:hypothetical protein